MIVQAIDQAVSGRHLSEEEMVRVMDQIMEGGATPAQIAAFIIALRIKGETVAEITGAARVMRQKATRVPTRAAAAGEPLVDVVGTGGDGSGTFNVSSTSAFVVAGAGAKVAKHGNRAVSSKSGAADLMEALGINLGLTAEEVGRCVDETGLGFLFAPVLHGAMKHAIGPRREIAQRTVFNLLGPLTNPAGATALVVGVYDPRLVHPLAEVLKNLGERHALVVHGAGHLDEISIAGPTTASRLEGETITDITIHPSDLGIPTADLATIKGGDPGRCKEITLGVLSGQIGPCRDMVLMNAGAALMVAGLADDLAGGVELAARSIDSGAALAKLEAVTAFSRAGKAA